jgi:hypothetical protein
VPNYRNSTAHALEIRLGFRKHLVDKDYFLHGDKNIFLSSLQLLAGLTYLLTPWSRVLLEKLTVNFAVSQEFTRIYGTRKFLTVPTSACHLSLS